MNDEVGSRRPTLVLVFDGFTGGGAERVGTWLATSLAIAGSQVHLATVRPPKDDVPGIQTLDVARTVLGDSERAPNHLVGLVRNLRLISRLRKVLKQHPRATVVSLLTTNNVRTVVASRWLPLRVIVAERNDTSQQPQDWPWPWLRKRTYRFADVVTANSQVALDDMRGYVPEAKLALTPNAVQLPTSIAEPDRSTTILSVGRLVPHKGHHLTIEALAQSGEIAEAWGLTILGDGPEANRLSTLAASRGMQARVRLPGYVLDPSSYYLSAGIFVLASEYEGTPNALLEAMAHGLPCVVSDALPGALSYVEDGVSGLVFRSGDSSDLADKLRCLIQDAEARVRLGRAARRSVSTVPPDRVLSIWEDLIDGR